MLLSYISSATISTICTIMRPEQTTLVLSFFFLSFSLIMVFALGIRLLFIVHILQPVWILTSFLFVCDPTLAWWLIDSEGILQSMRFFFSFFIPGVYSFMFSVCKILLCLECIEFVNLEFLYPFFSVFLSKTFLIHPKRTLWDLKGEIYKVAIV